MNNYVKAGIILLGVIAVIVILTWIHMALGAPSIAVAVFLGLAITIMLGMVYFMIYDVLET